MTNDVEYLLTNLLYWLFIIFCEVSLAFFVELLLGFFGKSSLCTLNMNSLLSICTPNIFSQSVACLFVFFFELRYN